MAWNPSPKVADCREIARKWGASRVIIVAINDDGGTMEYASFGETKALCAKASACADAAYDAIYNAIRDGKG